MDLARELKKQWNMCHGKTNCSWCALNGPKETEERTGGTKNE